MALAIPAALKQLLGLNPTVATPDSTGASGETWGKDNPYGLPADMPKNYGVTDDWSGGEPKGTYGPVDKPQKLQTLLRRYPNWFGPAVNPTDQAAAEALDPTGASASIRPKESLEGLQKPQENAGLKQSLVQAAKAAGPLYAQPVSPKDVAAEQTEAPAAATPNSPSHAVPHALLELMGMAGPQPKAGELYTGPTSLANKIRAGIGFAAKLGNAGAAAAGTPEQQKLAEQRAEFGPELAQKGEIAKAQIKSLGDYRVGRLNNADDANNIKQQQADIAQQKADQANQIAVGKMAKQAMVPDEQHPGAFRGMTPDEILTHPALAQDMALKHSALMVKNAQAALDQARTDVMLHPENYATFQQKERQIQATLKMAQSHLNNAIANTAIRAREGMWQFGENPLTGEQMTPDNAAPANMIGGQPTPMKSSAFPTSTMRNIEAQANTAAEGIPGTIQEITRLSNKLGPVSGRWNDFMQGKVGMDDPEFAGLRSDLLMVSSAVALAHARGRLPENLREEFDHMINAPQQTPENIVAILQHIQLWMQRASHMTIPAAPATKVPSFADWKKTQGGQ